MSLRLLENKIAVIPMEDPQRRASGIWVPDQAKQRIDQGIIKYRAEGCKELRVGDHVFFSGYDGTKVAIEGEGVLIIMRETYVKAVVEGEPEQLFPLQKILRIIEKCQGEFHSRIVFEEAIDESPASKSETVDYFKEILTARFENWFMSEGIEW